MRDPEKDRHRQREKQDPCEEPIVRLHPRTPGSRSGLKADAKPLSHPGIPCEEILKLNNLATVTFPIRNEAGVWTLNIDMTEFSPCSF